MSVEDTFIKLNYRVIVWQENDDINDKVEKKILSIHCDVDMQTGPGKIYRMKPTGYVTRIIFHHLSVMVTSLAKDTKMP